MASFNGGPVWTRKMRTLFRRLDVHGHGHLMVDDIIDVATSVLNVFHKMKLYKNDELVKCLVNFWYHTLGIQVERHKATSTMINEHQFVVSMEQALKGDFGTRFEELFATPLFTSMDQDDDDFITSNEYEVLMKSWSAIGNESMVVFKIYAQGNKLSKKAFCELMSKYFKGNDEKCNTNRLWGPLLAYKRAEDYGTLDCGPFWEGKMRSMFRRFDYNDTMKLRCSNLIGIGQSLIQRGHIDKKKADAVIRNMLHLWIKYLAVDKNGNHLDEIREIEFIHNLRDMINGDYRHEVDQFGWTFFKAMEVDNSGFITQAAYRNLQEVWHVGREEAEGMFKAIDTNKDGKISSDEFLHAWNEYFLGEDQSSPYRMFFGPVISRQTEAR